MLNLNLATDTCRLREASQLIKLLKAELENHLAARECSRLDRA